MSRKFKGIIFVFDLFIFALIVAASLAVLYLISVIPVVNQVVAIKTQAQLILFNIDKGSTIYTFLSSTDKGLGYEEILGNFAAKNNPGGMDSALSTTVDNLGGGLSILRDGNTIKTYGALTQRTLRADIALPGGFKGEVVVS